jgi:hypothetical protein
MSWRDLQPRSAAAQKDVPCRVSVGGRNFNLIISLMAKVVEPLGWRDGQKVAAQIGQGENAGRLRIVAGGIAPFTLHNARRGARLLLMLPHAEEIDREKRKPRAVEALASTNGKGELIVHLPPDFFVAPLEPAPAAPTAQPKRPEPARPAPVLPMPRDPATVAARIAARPAPASTGKVAVATRKCLTCGESFKSTGPQHRLCGKCRHRSE